MDTPHIPGLLQPRRFYSPRQIALACFLGSPLAAGWFISRNFLALADDARARHALWLGLAATAIVCVVAFHLPKEFPNALLPLIYTAATERYASWRFATGYDKHIKEGGPKGSWWTIVWVSLVVSALLVVLVVAGVLVAHKVVNGT